MGSREQREEENTSSEKPNRKHKQINKMAAQENKPVSTVVRDDFFNDPFFKDWWSDFDSPMQLKHGKFSVTVDIQDFDPEDIDIKVEGDFIVLVGNREIKRGNSFSVRQFNQRFPLPSGI